MSQGPLCPNLTKKVQKEVSQIANHNLPCPILLGGLSLHLNHLIKGEKFDVVLFVIRFYGGIHLGGNRYEIHKRRANNALKELQKGNTRLSKLPLKQTQDNPNKKSKKPKVHTSRAKTALAATHPQLGNAIRVQQPRQASAGAQHQPHHQPRFQPRFRSSTYNRFASLAQQSSAEDYELGTPHSLNWSSQGSNEEGVEGTTAPAEDW